MNEKYDRYYVTKHERIMSKLREITETSNCGCVLVPRIAAELGMDQRTVKSHLKIIEVDKAGMFVDPDEKTFCTKDGITSLAERLDIFNIVAAPYKAIVLCE